MYEMSLDEKSILEEIKSRLQNVYNPKLIYLFGSYAWGTPEQHSDIDIAVIVEESDEKSYKRVQVGLKELWSIEKPIDLLVYTINEFKEKSGHPSTLQYKIEQKGVKLYEAL